MKRFLLTLLPLALYPLACGSSSSAPPSNVDNDASLVLDSGPDQVAVPPTEEDAALDATDAADPCDIGTASSIATASDLAVFGQVVPFAGGQSLAAGVYEVSYVDGCIKYGGGQKWTVNAYGTGSYDWMLVGATSADRIAVLPGAIGISTYDVFEDCVTASKLAAPLRISHPGGPLGVYLVDSPYEDNVAGENGRNPSWKLTALTCKYGGDASIPDAQ